MAAFVEAGGYTHVLAPVSNATKDYVPRVAAALGVSPVTDVCEVRSGAGFISLQVGRAAGRASTRVEEGL